ncbi:hypothetical protein LJC18_00345 [Lachnospiraceae bacterium OttesenSCG-928-E19]|nr:hypothetical protein [Lachnospiraceae bacterium OttesenSCG-928-E19]
MGNTAFAATAPARGNINEYASPSNAPRARASDFISNTSYDNLYPVMNNKMRTKLNDGNTPSQGQNPISTLVRTSDTPSSGRRVVARSGTVARSATTSGGGNSNAARSATTNGTNNTASNTRRVVARSGTTNTNARGVRADNSMLTQRQAGSTGASAGNEVSLPADRCLADYTQCMNGYCERQNTGYNRCYCSARLSQIDSQYQPEINRLILKILELRDGANVWDQNEMNEYWENAVGQYTGDNSWNNLDDALDINWADTESRVRGQQAFLTGHDYCAQHLRGCYYMAGNMRDAYRSEIARDCAVYENSLQRIKNAAESLVNSYNE